MLGKAGLNVITNGILLDSFSVDVLRALLRGIWRTCNRHFYYFSIFISQLCHKYFPCIIFKYCNRLFPFLVSFSVAPEEG